jgi:RNA polymerase sigma factor (sigma-70 family)
MPTSVNGALSRLKTLLSVRESDQFSDRELLLRFVQTSDQVAFELIVRRHGPMVLGVCRRLLRNSADADDAFQATFMVLVRRAASLSQPEKLAGWLNRTAYITARKIRNSLAYRRAQQVPLNEPATDAPVAEIIWRELAPIFDEELHRLPDRLRLPIVLCFLEGRTKRATAAILGWPEGTISSRLQRARELLRCRLTRRGIALSTGVFSLALFHATASAAVPALLLSSTIQSASQIALGAAFTGPVAMLTEGVLRSMYYTKLKFVAVMVLSIGILGSSTSWIIQSAGTSDIAFAQEKGTEKAPTKAPPKDTRPALIEAKLAVLEQAHRQAREQEAALRAEMDAVRAQLEQARRLAEENAVEAKAQRDVAEAARQQAQAQAAKAVAEMTALRMALEAERKKLENLMAIAAKVAPQFDWNKALNGLQPTNQPVPGPGGAPMKGARPGEAIAPANKEAAEKRMHAMHQLKAAEAGLEKAKATLGQASANYQLAEQNLKKIMAESERAPVPGPENTVPGPGGPSMRLTGPLAPPQGVAGAGLVRFREADVKIAAAKRNMKKIQFENTRRLAKDNVVSASELALAQGEFDIAEAELEKTQILLQIALEEIKGSGTPKR